MRRLFEASALLRTIRITALLFAFCRICRAQDVRTILIDTSAPAHPFPHFWERTFGSGRSTLALRHGYRSDLREAKKATDFQYVCFHAIFHDELDVYDEDKDGNAVYNFCYIEQVYDDLLENGVRPFVEISFMARKLAAR